MFVASASSSCLVQSPTLSSKMDALPLLTTVPDSSLLRLSPEHEEIAISDAKRKISFFIILRPLVVYDSVVDELDE
jgi:hypothetical protein